MAALGDVALGSATGSLRVRVGDLLAAPAAAQGAAVDVFEEGVAADSAALDDPVRLSEPLRLLLAPAQVLISQASLLGPCVLVPFGITGERLNGAAREQFASFQSPLALAQSRSLTEACHEFFEEPELGPVMPGEERVERGALRAGRLAVFEADVERLVQHPGNRVERRAPGRVEPSLVFGREEKCVGGPAAQLNISPAAPQLVT